MTNEMKLLTALCEALGFEVVVKRDYKEREVSGREKKALISRNVLLPVDKHSTGRIEELALFTLDDGDDGGFVAVLVEPEISYELRRVEGDKKATQKHEDARYFQTGNLEGRQWGAGSREDLNYGTTTKEKRDEHRRIK